MRLRIVYSTPRNNEDAMNNDLNTPKALQILWKLVRDEEAEGKLKKTTDVSAAKRQKKCIMRTTKNLLLQSGYAGNATQKKVKRMETKENIEKIIWYCEFCEGFVRVTVNRNAVCCAYCWQVIARFKKKE